MGLSKSSQISDRACNDWESFTDIGSRAPVFEITVSLGSDVPRHTDGSTTIGNARAECTDVLSLMTTSETKFVVFAVDGDVLRVPLRKLLDSSFDVLNAARFAHLLGAVVAVTASTVPIALERFGVEGDFDAPLLGDTDEEVTSHPEVVTHGNALARADLKLPLSRHHLGIDAADVDTSVETCAIVSFDEITGEYLART